MGHATIMKWTLCGWWLLFGRICVLLCLAPITLRPSSEPLCVPISDMPAGQLRGDRVWLQSMSRLLSNLEHALAWQASNRCCRGQWRPPLPTVWAQLDEFKAGIADDPMAVLTPYPGPSSHGCTLIGECVASRAPRLLEFLLEHGADPFQQESRKVLDFIDQVRQDYNLYEVLLGHVRKRALTREDVVMTLSDRLPGDIVGLVTAYVLQRDPIRCLQDFYVDHKTLLDCELQKPLPGICNPGCKDVDYIYDTYATVYDLIQLGVGLSQEVSRQRLRRMRRRRICSELVYCTAAAVGLGLGVYLDNGPVAATGLCFALVGRLGYDLCTALRYGYVVRRSGVLNMYQV